MPKIYWELNWLNQEDPNLIKFIKENLLIPPPTPGQNINLRNNFDGKQAWHHQGQNGEALIIETLYGLNKEINKKSK